MVHEDLVSAPTTGINFYQSTTDFDVNKGDVIGVIQLSGALYQQTMSSGSCYELAVTTGHTGGGSLTLTSAMTCLDGQHQFLAHMIKVSCIFSNTSTQHARHPCLLYRDARPVDGAAVARSVSRAAQASV